MGTQAFQNFDDFQGDHLSANMFSLAKDGIAGLSRMLYDGGSISLSTPTTLTSSSPFFRASDVGMVVTVQGAGAGGATLVTSISGYTSTGQVTIATAATT